MAPKMTFPSISSSSTFLSPAAPAPTTPPSYELFKRAQEAQECGDLQGKYPNAQAPTCTGSASMCTFSAGYQGCCDSSSNCTFYTSCQGGLAPASNRCTDAGCLQCPSAVPYCTRYEFGQGLTAYEGFACGSYYVTDSLIYGTVASRTVAAGSSTSSSSGSHASTTGSSSITSGSSSATTSRPSSTSASATATGTTQASVQAVHKVSTGLLAGVIVGGVLLLLAIIIAFMLIRRRRAHNREKDAAPLLDQGRRY